MGGDSRKMASHALNHTVNRTVDQAIRTFFIEVEHQIGLQPISGGRKQLLKS
jgi:hypothetical protein